MPKFTLTAENRAIKIHVNGVLHCAIARDNLAAVHAWKSGRWHVVELMLKSGQMVKLEYNTEAKWLAVLKLLDGANLFPREGEL